MAAKQEKWDTGSWTPKSVLLFITLYGLSVNENKLIWQAEDFRLHTIGPCFSNLFREKSTQKN